MVKLYRIDEVKIREKKRFKVEGEEVLAIRLKDGLYAVENMCLHAGCQLSFYEGVREDKRIVCTCHGTAFYLNDGRVVEGPAQTPLKVYSVKVTKGEPHVEL